MGDAPGSEELGYCGAMRQEALQDGAWWLLGSAKDVFSIGGLSAAKATHGQRAGRANQTSRSTGGGDETIWSGGVGGK